MLTVRARAKSEVIVAVYVPGARSRLILFAAVVRSNDFSITGAFALS